MLTPTCVFGRYPANLTVARLAYFLVAPTLVYQTSYPMSSRRSRSRVLMCAPCLAVLQSLLPPGGLPGAVARQSLLLEGWRLCACSSSVVPWLAASLCCMRFTSLGLRYTSLGLW